MVHVQQDDVSSIPTPRRTQKSVSFPPFGLGFVCCLFQIDLSNHSTA